MSCAVCQTRRPRRFCPGVRGDICAICCGVEREASVSCPLDCEYLRESRKHEKIAPLPADQIPNQDIKLSEDFLEKHEELIAFLGYRIADAALRSPGAADRDAREALDGLVRTYRTLESGVYYESRPANPLAAGIFSSAKDAVDKFRQREHETLGLTRTRDSDVLGALVFLQRVELDRNNGRPRGRAFLDLLRESYPGAAGPSSAAESNLVLP
jgi:hypothetical protein